MDEKVHPLLSDGMCTKAPRRLIIRAACQARTSLSPILFVKENNNRKLIIHRTVKFAKFWLGARM